MALFKSSYKGGAEGVKLSKRLAEKYLTPKSVSEIEDTISTASSKGANKAGKEIAESVQTATGKNAAKNIGGNLANKAKVSMTSLIAGTGIGALGTAIATPMLSGGGDPDPTPTPTPHPKPKFIYDPNTGMFSPFAGAGEGGTAYLSGDGYGESGVSVIEETAETLKQYAPYLIGFGVIVVIVALVTGNRKGKGKKKGGNRK